MSFLTVPIPSVAKATLPSISSCGTAKQLAEKVAFPIQIPKNVPQGLKPGIDSIGIVPGMNPRPTARLSFSASCKAVPFQIADFCKGSLT